MPSGEGALQSNTPPPLASSEPRQNLLQGVFPVPTMCQRPLILNFVCREAGKGKEVIHRDHSAYLSALQPPTWALMEAEVERGSFRSGDLDYARLLNEEDETRRREVTFLKAPRPVRIWAHIRTSSVQARSLCSSIHLACVFPKHLLWARHLAQQRISKMFQGTVVISQVSGEVSRPVKITDRKALANAQGQRMATSPPPTCLAASLKRAFP